MRVDFSEGKQKAWINELIKKNSISVSQIAHVCGISTRTVRDWRREKFKITKKALLQLSKLFNINIPSDVRYLPDYWYVSKGARKGALKRLEIYGPPGTVEGRKKGGKISQLRRKLHPELYPNCILRKKYLFPKKSIQLAELVGIILGDGGITDYQLKITLNKETESEYIEFISKLIKKLFSETPQKYFYNSGRKEKVCNLCLGGVDLINFLEELGLHRGNKVVHQVEVPRWVEKDKKYSEACLRGLIDTDGAVYYHKHFTRGFSCFNLGLTFTNYSKPLVEFVNRVLLKYNFTSKLKEQSVYMYRLSEIKKYFKIIGSHNVHHIQRLEKFLKLKKNIRRSTQVA